MGGFAAYLWYTPGTPQVHPRYTPGTPQVHPRYTPVHPRDTTRWAGYHVKPRSVRRDDSSLACSRRQSPNASPRSGCSTEARSTTGGVLRSELILEANVALSEYEERPAQQVLVHAPHLETFG